MAISAAQVKELRERTGAGMMECKKALVETDGDIEAAIEHMRKTGLTKADIRDLSREMGLDTWDKPAMACLSSRFAYGVAITDAGLLRVDAAEVNAYRLLNAAWDRGASVRQVEQGYQVTGLDADEAAAFALARHPALVARRAQLGVERALAVEAGLLPDPTFSWNAMDWVVGGTSDDVLTGLSLTFPLLRPGERGAARSSPSSSTPASCSMISMPISRSNPFTNSCATYLP